MRVRLVPADAAGLAAAVAALRAGGIVAFPTDTVFGIAVALETPGGIERLFAVKRRPPDRAISVLVDSLDQVDGVVGIPAAARVLAAAFWPGGLTIVLPVLAGVRLPAALTAGTETLGVRIPDHAVPRAIAREVGPLPTTSANRHGEPPAPDGEAVVASLGGGLEVVVDGSRPGSGAAAPSQRDGPGPGGGTTSPRGTPSTVVDCSSGPPRVLRSGAVPIEALAAVLDDADLAHLIRGPGPS